MEPYETGDPSGLDLMQTFAPAAVLLPLPGLHAHDPVDRLSRPDHFFSLS
jgi:hypothetical protein